MGRFIAFGSKSLLNVDHVQEFDVEGTVLTARLPRGAWRKIEFKTTEEAMQALVLLDRVLRGPHVSEHQMRMAERRL